MPFVLADATAITSFANTTDQTAYSTGSVAPISGELVLVAVNNVFGGTTAIPTLSGTNGWSVTWTQVDTVDYQPAGTERRITLFRGVPSSSVAGVLTADFAGVTQTGCMMSVVSWANVDQTTNQGVVQSATNTTAGATSLTVTLAAFANANNAAYGAFGILTSAAQTPGAGFTELHDLNHSAPSIAMMTEWRIDNDTSVDQSSAASLARGGIAVELDFLESGATHPSWNWGGGGW